MNNRINLKELFRQAGLTINHAAETMGVTPEYVSMVVNNHRKAIAFRRKLEWYLNQHISLNRKIAA